MLSKYIQPIDTWKDAQHHSSLGKCKSKPQWGITSHLSEWLKSATQETTILGKDIEKRNPPALLVGMYTGAATVENSMEVPQKIKNRTIIWSSNSSNGYLPKENENTNSKRYIHPYVYCSIIYNSQDKEAIQVSINRWMDTDEYTHTHTHTHTQWNITQP